MCDDKQVVIVKVREHSLATRVAARMRLDD